MEHTSRAGKICELREFFRTQNPGKIRQEDTIERIENLVADCWEEFTMGVVDGGMQADKVWGRLEDLEWEPPDISFKIERHGAMFLGSSRAEMQSWVLNLDEGSKEVVTGGYRQTRPRQSNLDVRSIAEELSNAILARRVDYRLKWMDPDRDDVRILMGQILPAGFDAKQTLRGRSGRLGALLTALLLKEGWKKTTANRYSKATGDRPVQPAKDVF